MDFFWVVGLWGIGGEGYEVLLIFYRIVVVKPIELVLKIKFETKKKRKGKKVESSLKRAHHLHPPSSSSQHIPNFDPNPLVPSSTKPCPGRITILHLLMPTSPVNHHLIFSREPLQPLSTTCWIRTVEFFRACLMDLGMPLEVAGACKGLVAGRELAVELFGEGVDRGSMVGVDRGGRWRWLGRGVGIEVVEDG